jgi:hypothetical protein
MLREIEERLNANDAGVITTTDLSWVKGALKTMLILYKPEPDPNQVPQTGEARRPPTRAVKRRWWDLS